MQEEVCLNPGLSHQTHTIEIARNHISWLLILEDIDQFNPMGVTVFPSIKSYDVLLKTHYFPLLYMTTVSYTANQISGYNIAGLFVLSLVTKKGKIESYFLLLFPINPAASVPSMDLCYAPSRSLYSISSLIFWVSVAACSMNISHCW